MAIPTLLLISAVTPYPSHLFFVSSGSFPPLLLYEHPLTVREARGTGSSFRPFPFTSHSERPSTFMAKGIVSVFLTQQYHQL